VRAVEGPNLGGFCVQPFFTGSGSGWGCVLRTACANIARSSSLVIAGVRGVGFHEVICIIWDAAGGIKAIQAGKGRAMSKRENDANNVFRPSDSPLTEYEKEQIALRKNLERLKAERLAREAAKQKDRRK
jgi:Zn-dependent alcohol dehydrogenase